MKRSAVFIFFLVSSSIMLAQTYTPADDGSKVHFVIDNFGIGTGGDFTGLTGSIKYDPANLASAEFDVSVDASSINTGIQSRDNHLRGSEYFDVKDFPKLSFKSSKITKTNKDGFLYMFGNLTIKGVSKEIKFPFSVIAKNGGYLFEGQFKINRRDFGVGGNSISLSDDVSITLSVFAKPG